MKVWEMRQVMKPQLRDEAMAEEVMMEEWGHMSKGAIIDKVRTKEFVRIFVVEAILTPPSPPSPRRSARP